MLKRIRRPAPASVIICIYELAPDGQIMNMDVLQALRSLEGEGRPFDCIFMDPPYGMDLERSALEYLSGSALADVNTLIIVEAELHTDFSYVEEMRYETYPFQRIQDQ